MQAPRKDVQFVAQVDYDRRDAKSSSLAIIGLVSIFVIVAFVVGIYYFYTITYEQTQYDQYSGVASTELTAIHEREDEQLHKFGYINKEAGLVRLSVERAMQLVEADAIAGKVAWNTASYPAKAEPEGGAAGMIWSPDGTAKAAPVAEPAASPAKK